MSAELSTVAADGTVLRGEEHGDSGVGLTVVLTHGWVLDRRTWRAQVAGLPRMVGRPLRIIAYDHRGHGRSDAARAGTATIAQLGDDLAEVLAAHVPAGRVVLAGHSMGGMTIMALAERHPALFAEKVAAAAFVSTSGGGLRQAGRLPAPVLRRVLARGNRPPGRLVSAGARWVLRRSIFGPNAAPGQVNLAAEIIAAHWPATLLAFRDTFNDHERLAALVACQGLPVAVLCGTADRLCPPEHARRIAAAIPGAEADLYPGAGHMLTLERPAEVTARLADLVRAVQGAAPADTPAA